MSPQTHHERKSDGLNERTRNLIAWIAAVGSVLLMTLIFSLMVVFYANHLEIVQDVAKTHFRGIVGPPMSAMTALAVVTFLRVTSGSLEFKAFGFEFKGASGPVVLWVLAFLACAAGITALW
jgi:hypothetical protein